MTRRGRPPNVRSLGFWEALDLWPPIMVRLTGRKLGRLTAITSEEIAITTDIPLSRVIEISQQFTWDEVTTGEMRRFCSACEFDPTLTAHRNRQFFYLRTCQKKKMDKVPPFLTKHPAWLTEFLPLIHRLKSRLSSSTQSATPNGRVYAA